MNENLNFTIRNFASGNQGTDGCFTLALWNKGLKIKIATHVSCSGQGPLSLVYEATAPLELVLVAQYRDTTAEKQTVNTDEIIFTLALDTNMPDKNETTTRTSTSIASSRKTIEVPGSTTEEILTSETLEVLSGATTVGESTATSSECFKASNDGGPFYPQESDAAFMDITETIWATIMASNLTSAPHTCGLSVDP